MWDSEMVTLLRYMIDDISETPKYDDDRLATLLLVGAQFVQEENLFKVSYSIDVENLSLKPDPTSKTTRDNSFINLTVLKSACLLASSGLSSTAAPSMLVVEGPYKFDNRGRDASSGKKLQVQTWCQAYTDAKWEYVKSNVIPGEAIIGPYRIHGGYRSLYAHRDRTL